VKRYLQGRNAVFVGVGVAAVCIAVALILVSVIGSGGGKKATPTTTSGPTPTRTTGTGTSPAVPGAAETTALFRGLHQRLNELGNPKAKTTMIEFADLQCPFCRDYALDALPAIVKEYVRNGKVRLVFSGMEFIGPDSDKALRAVYAAGLQGKLWNVLDLLYRNQGAENSGWVTDGLLRQIGDSVPGLDTDKMLADMQSSEVDAALAASSQQAQSAGVNSTPTFFAGPTGGTLQQIAITALVPEAFRPTLDSLTQ
jgi:protein-disulfide isomerase